jgi:exopolysaccharide production protein ExoZ
MQVSISKIAPYKMLDAWRGIAAIWVVMVHACLPAIVNQFPNLKEVFIYKFSLLGSLGVPMFFVISGYCIASAASNSFNRSNTLTYFLLCRIRRIYPPYLIVSIIAIVLSSFAAFLSSKGIIGSTALGDMGFFGQSPLYYLSALTLTQVPLHQKPLLTVFWTLNYEIFFYAIVGLMLCVAKYLQNPDLLLKGLNFLTLFCLGWLVISPETCFFPLELYPQFGLGVLVYNTLICRNNYRSLLFIGIAVFLLLVYAYLSNSIAEIGHASTRMQSLVCVFFAVLLLILQKFDKQIMKLNFVRWLAVVGTFSYSLYLTHLLPLGIVSQIGRRLNISEDLYWISFLAQIFVSILFAWGFYLFFEKPFVNAFLSNKSLPTVEEPKAN